MMLKKVVSRKSYVVSARILFFLLTTYCLQLTTCNAQPVSGATLIHNAQEYDGKTVVYEGEVIGDIMRRGEFVWINVNDTKNAIGIWIEKIFTKDIVYTGSYKSKGDWVEITGIFHRACPEHGGDLDIHAQALRKLKLGKNIPERLNLAKRNIAIILLGFLSLIWILKPSRRK